MSSGAFGRQLNRDLESLPRSCMVSIHNRWHHELAHKKTLLLKEISRMGYHYRPLLEVFREALRTLQNEPGPMIPAKAELMEYLRNRITEHEGLNRATAR